MRRTVNWNKTISFAADTEAADLAALDIHRLNVRSLVSFSVV
jgi:hypothetical protein